MSNDITEALLDRAICAFDIETVPDAAYGRENMGFEGSDQEVQDAMQQWQLEKTAGRTDFLPVHLHQVVTLSIAWWYPANDTIKVATLEEDGIDEKAILIKFAEILKKAYNRKGPRLVSWNGTSFDLPVCHFRWMVHGIDAGNYWQPPSRFEAYANRYNFAHVDLMDVVGNFVNRTRLDEVAQLLGFPGKTVTEGHRVFQHIARGEIELVQGYCEMDAVNTMLIFWRYCVTRGEIDGEREQALWRKLADHLDERTARPGWSEMAQLLRNK